MSTSVSPCAEAAVAAEETLDGGEMVAVECDLADLASVRWGMPQVARHVLYSVSGPASNAWYRIPFDQ